MTHTVVRLSAAAVGGIVAMAIASTGSALSLCPQLFESTMKLPKFETVVTLNEAQSARGVVQVQFEVTPGPWNRALLLRTTSKEGREIGRLNINRLIERYGEIESFRKVEYVHHSTLMEESALRIQPSQSLIATGFARYYVLTKAVFVLSAKTGVHFVEIQGPGEIVITGSIETGAGRTIRKKQIGWINSQGGSDTREVIEVQSSTGRFYFDPNHQMVVPSHLVTTASGPIL